MVAMTAVGDLSEAADGSQDGDRGRRLDKYTILVQVPQAAAQNPATTATRDRRSRPLGDQGTRARAGWRRRGEDAACACACACSCLAEI
ncbi:hypothetical protein ACP70R_033767 [Stipagrostis hirtigluma subsp. patula]